MSQLTQSDSKKKESKDQSFDGDVSGYYFGSQNTNWVIIHTEVDDHMYGASVTVKNKVTGETKEDYTCYSRNGTVLVEHNGDVFEKRVDQLKKGDKVFSMKGCYNRITHLTRQYVKNIEMIKIENSNLLITKWHPVMINGKWTFPCHSLNHDKQNYIGYIYNIAVENGSDIVIGSIPVITLGHGIKNDEVAEHPYFGTDKVIADLNNIPENEGYINLTNCSYMRDVNGLVSKILI